MFNQALATPQVITAVERRYSDAYIVAGVINGFGDTVKGLGIAFGALLLMLALFVGSQGAAGVVIAALIAVAGVCVGILLYLLGVLLAAQGQILKASLDTAVNSSPFLPDEIRGRIMSLPVVQAATAGSRTETAPPRPAVNWRCVSCGKVNDLIATQCGLCGEARTA